MMCSRCRKRPAVVFMSGMSGSQKFENGYCLKCAKELGIPQVDNYLKQMGLSDIDLDADPMAMFGDRFSAPEDDDYDDEEEISAEDGDVTENDEDETEENDEDRPDAFKQGGTMPAFFQRFFNASSNGAAPPAGGDSAKSDTSRKEKERKKKAEKNKKFLNTFCTNLTENARTGKTDRIIGRDKEIERVIQILSRRSKNNPCLIGEPGVGKTAIAEGIAQRIVEGRVPFRLQDKELYLLDLTALVAGTQFRGQFESRVKSLIEEIKINGNIMLFIDEVHNLVGTGDSEGTMNAANMFKPALSRGELQVIGATTFNEYRKYIEKDAALERRFQPVTVNEPTIDETVELLRGIKGYYEQHHKITIDAELIRPCVTLSERYITDRYLPDKAIDLLDEASACASIRSAELTAYEKCLKKAKELEVRESELAGAKEPDYEKLAEVKTEKAKNDAELERLKPLAEKVKLTAADLSTVIEMWTGIPAKKIMETEFRKISGLEATLKSKIIGQDEACEKVAKAVKRSRVNLTTKRRPASFIFVGPTGVGKTQLVKVLSEELFSGVEPLIRLDMSEYMEKHSVSKIIGSPPGYVGFDDAGQLTEKVRRRPYSVILFDEIEKAHPDVMNILLQILDEGRISDSHGKNVNFENTLICMTSNAGSSSGESGMGFGKTTGDLSKEKAMKALKEFLRPEFLGRVDEVVVFSPLTKENYADIAKLQLDDTVKALAENGTTLNIDASAYKYIAEKSHGGKYGGRDILRVIREEVEDPIAELLIRTDSPSGRTIELSANDSGIIVQEQETAPDKSDTPADIPVSDDEKKDQ
ncbi:MAG: ATP-dependent Clp protease ATP-binding subunit [Ruminiclostridium sp.]|nr:ATP-dependent Clp protease ATP-binding subunit [Ruminiclostridium sp.]